MLGASLLGSGDDASGRLLPTDRSSVGGTYGKVFDEHCLLSFYPTALRGGRLGSGRRVKLGRDGRIEVVENQFNGGLWRGGKVKT